MHVDHGKPQPARLTAPESGIVEVVNYARGREGLLPLWVGEGDLPTPDFISRAAMDALASGETFYTWQRGIPELRRALSDYYNRHFSVRLPAEHFYVTGSGMQAIQISVQALTSPGDEFVYLTPAWPNIAAALEIAGARSVGVELQFEGGKWALDLDRVEAAITPKTRGIFINTPSNPTGWTATKRISAISWRLPARTTSGSWRMKSTPSIILPAAVRLLSST